MLPPRKFLAWKELNLIRNHLNSVFVRCQSRTAPVAILTGRNFSALSQTYNSFCPPAFAVVNQRCLISTSSRLLKKKKNAEKKNQLDDDDDEEEEDENEILFGDKKNLKTVNGTSTRVDMLLKNAFKYSRKHIETSFYDGRIYLNGKKLQKKHHIMQLGDEIDLVHEVSPDSPKFLIVSRAELVSVDQADDEDPEKGLKIKLLCFKNTKVNNYNPPFKHSVPTEANDD